MHEKPFSELAIIFPLLSLVTFYGLLYLNWGNSSQRKSKDVVKSPSAQTNGFLSLSQVLAFVSVIGIVISLAPALVDIEKIFSLHRLIEFIVDYYEFFAYPISLYLIHLGLASTMSAGMYTSLLGTTVIAGAFVRDLEIHFRYPRDFTDEMQMYIGLYTSLYLIPLALYFQSRLCGFLAITQLQRILSLLNLCKIFIQILGFDDQASIAYGFVTTGILIGIFVIGKVSSVPSIMDPFTTGINTYAVLQFLSYLFVIALKAYTSPVVYALDAYTSPVVYWVRQLYFILGVLGILMSGHIVGIPRMVSFGNIFIAFYLASKYGEFIYYSGMDYVWIHVLISSCLLFMASSYLQNRPATKGSANAGPGLIRKLI